MIQAGLSQAAADRIALRWYALPAVVSGFVALMWFMTAGIRSVPITGETSIALVSVYGAVVVGLGAFGLAYRYGQQHRNAWDNISLPRKILDITTLTISHVLVTLAVSVVLFVVFANAFKGLMFDPYTAALLVASVIGLTTYILVTLALTVTVSQIIAMLSIVMIGGVLLAMVTNQQANWWQINLSYLGTSDSINSFTFNFTLAFSGFMMIALSRFVFAVPKQRLPQYSRNISVLEGLFVATSLALAGVGLFPYTPNTILVQLHNTSATLLVVFIMAMIAGLRWYVPAVSREFSYTSYLFALVLTVMVWLFQGVGYLSLTAFEISAFGVGFVWLVLLMRNLQFLNAAVGTSKKQPVSTRQNTGSSVLSI